MKDCVKIKLDRKRRLKFTAGPIDTVYKKLKFRWPKLSIKEAEKIVRKWQEFDLEYLSLFLWAGLAWEDPGLTVNEVRNMLKALQDNPGELSLIVIALIKATSLFNIRLKRAERECQKLTANTKGLKGKYSDLLRKRKN